MNTSVNTKEREVVKTTNRLEYAKCSICGKKEKWTVQHQQRKGWHFNDFVAKRGVVKGMHLRCIFSNEYALE